MNQHRQNQKPQPAKPSTYPPVLPGARVAVYKTVDDVELRVWIFEPDAPGPGERRPAIVFFFGGGWQRGNPAQFEAHCRYLAARGMVAMTADYRVDTRHGVKPHTCVADAKSAVRWIRANAAHLSVDPDRIAAGGGSAGGHLAAATATLPAYDDPQDDRSISARPDALVLFNPALVLASIPGTFEMPRARIVKLADRLGVEPASLSPYRHVTPDVPPAIIFHGTADATVPYETAALFAEAMRDHDNRCELVGYQGCGHGFFNVGRDHNGPFVDTVHRMDGFLTSLGYLVPPPPVTVRT
jgi:acetyl esterase/lipase